MSEFMRRGVHMDVRGRWDGCGSSLLTLFGVRSSAVTHIIQQTNCSTKLLSVSCLLPPIVAAEVLGLWTNITLSGFYVDSGNQTQVLIVVRRGFYP